MRLRLLLVIALLAATAAAQRVSRFDSSIVVDRDGAALVIETVEFAGPIPELRRTVPVRLPGVYANHELVVDVVRAETLSGKRLRWKRDREGNDVVLRIEQPVAGARLTYWVRNAVDFSGRRDNLAWVATDPAYLIDRASVRLLLPGSAAGKFGSHAKLTADAGEETPALWSSSGLVPVRHEGATAIAESPGALAPGVAMQVSASIDKGLLHPPGVLRRASWFLAQNRIVLFPGVTLLILLALRWWKRRLEPTEATLVAEYEPPEGLTPAEAGALADDHVDPRDVGATLIDLIGRGYVRADRADERVEGERNFKLILENPLEHCVGLAAHERTMLFHSFYGGVWTELHSLRLRFPTIVPYFERDVMKALRLRGYYRMSPRNSERLREAVLLLTGIVLAAAHFTGMLPLFQSPVLAVVAVGLSTALVLWLSPTLSAKTREGMRAWAHVRGFQHFMETVERDRMRRITPELFEKYLPYAVALKVEGRWRAAFETIATVPGNYIEQTEIALTREWLGRGEPVGSLFDVAQGIIWPSEGTLPTPPRGRTRAARA